MKKMRANFTLAALVFLPSITFAVTPTITSVKGTTQTGQTLIISGGNMVDSNTTGWSFAESSGSFEGSSPGSDGWNTTGSPAYDTSIKLLGSKSLRSSVTGGGGTNCPTNNAFGGTVYRTSDRYNRIYVYFDSGFSTLWDNAGYQKIIEYVSPTGVYLQPNTGNTTINSLLTIAGDSSASMNLPTAWTTGRWYAVEWYVASNGLTVWVDGIQIGTLSGSINFGAPYPQLGIINSCPVSGTYSLHIDGVASSSSRVYPASMIEIGNNSNYATATKVYQPPIFLSDDSIQISADLTELGSGPYYLWVTNNRRERSQPYTLGAGGGGDTTPPTATITAPSNGVTVSGTATVNATASDNIGVAGIQFKVNGNNLGAEDTSPPYSTSWNTTLLSNGTYTLTASARDTAGNTTTSAPVTVTLSNAASTPAAPTVSLTANPASIASGQSSSLAWSSTNATSCTASGGWTGTQTTSGTRSVSPTSTTNYTLSCTGTGGTAQQTATVTVTSSTPAPTVSLAANPSTLALGQSSTLSWSSTNATSCTASGSWTGTKAVSSSESVSPTTTSTYTLTCTGTGGSTSQSSTITVGSAGSTTFFSEGYEDTNFAARGWYDDTTGTLSTDAHTGTYSLQCTYAAGGTSCVAPRRHKFASSDSVYVSYWVKYSSNFVGSGVSYHPHEFYFLTNLNGDYDGLAFDYLTLYLESHWSSSSSGTMQVGIQDGQNIDQSRIGQNLIGVTENRAVAGCNGSPSGYVGECYNRGDGVYVNGVLLSTPQTFTTANKNNWNHVEAYYQLNSISNGIGQADGIIRVWFNDSLVFERTNAILRTGQRPTMKLNQLIFAPWIGDGSPVTQTFWIDDLVVASARPGSGSAFASPANLRIAP